ncbi:carbonic anhydrase 2-like [Agrilus planipennis]|uniref:Carbonic anhydrase n=1 Tax=Agrilus planipennis TaxID=224129 RepID=A0A1W4WZE0_AGRPL|nr:carbonic anhydrase 2-like [Agrilus planipennis]
MVQFVGFLLLTFGAAFASYSSYNNQRAEEESHWSYDDQNDWPELCNSGTRQSPIDIRTPSIEQSHFSPFIFSGYSERFFADVTNTGHTVRINLRNDSKVPTVEEGGLPGTYALDSVHFHWNSEHTINGRRYPAELHAVHYDVKYGNVDNAITHENGVAVFAILFEISSEDNENFNPIMPVIDEVDDTVGMTARTDQRFSPNIFFPRDTSGYYRYIGSLTTPDCNEGVIWTIFRNVLRISESQVSYFTNIQSETGLLTENYRTLQAVNNRPVYENISPLPKIHQRLVY